MTAAAVLVALLAQGPTAGPSGHSERASPVEAHVPALTVSLGSMNLVLGIDQETELRIELGPGVQSAEPPRVLATTGHVDDLVRTGERSFVGRYVLPAERFPQAAILVAELPSMQPRVRGLLVVPLRAAASPAFHTDAGAAVTLRIGEKEFGPQKAPRDGNVRIPVVVPPGVTFGLARSTNEFGETTEQTVDLKIPPFRRMLVVAPDTIRAGSVEEIAVYAVDTAGLPLDSGHVVVTSPTGKAQPLGGQPGEARFLVRAPPLVATGALHIKAALRNDRDVAMPVDIPVVAGQPAHLVLRPDRARLAIGLGSSMRVYLSAQDQFGNGTDAGSAAVLVDGVQVPTRSTEDGRVVAVVPAPVTDGGQDHLEIEAALGPTYTAQRIPLMNLRGPTAAARGAYPRLTVTPRLGFVWSFQQPPGAALMLEVLGRGARWPEQLLLGMGVGLLATDVDVGDSLGTSHLDLRQIPILALGRFQYRAASRLILAASAGAGVTFAQGRVRSYEREVRGETLAPTLEAGVEAAVRLVNGQAVVGTRYMLVSVGKLSSGDQLVGNAAGLIMDLGYRIAW
jgi:hypothetical protein